MPDSAHTPSRRSLLGRKFLLGIDTCGSSGSVALGEIIESGENSGKLRLLGQTELAGRTYSATLVSSVSDLLSQAAIGLAQLHAIVAVNGPGSFTGVRVGVSAAKGLAEAGDGIPVIAVSRLEVLSAKAGVPASALDAHRNEIFLRIPSAVTEIRELLASPQEIAQVNPAPSKIAVCDEPAAALLNAAWPSTELVRVQPPTASDALELCLPHIARGERADLALLDGHYLRRSDAEIFGDPTSPQARRA